MPVNRYIVEVNEWQGKKYSGWTESKQFKSLPAAKKWARELSDEYYDLQTDAKVRVIKR